MRSLSVLNTNKVPHFKRKATIIFDWYDLTVLEVCFPLDAMSKDDTIP